MELEEQQLVIKWRSLGELKEKLRTILGELEIGTREKASQDISHSFSSTFSPGEPVPDEIKKVGLNKFGAAMLESLRHGHHGRSAAIDARRLAIEMKQRYPALFGRKDLGKIAHGTTHSNGESSWRRISWTDLSFILGGMIGKGNHRNSAVRIRFS